MQTFFKFIKNVLGALMFLCALMAPVMILYWILRFSQVGFADSWIPFFEPFNIFGRFFYDKSVKFGLANVDLSYLVSSVGFLIIYACVRIVQNGVEDIEIRHLRIVRKKEEEAENKREKIAVATFNTGVRKYTKFIAMVQFDLEYVLNDVLLGTEKGDIQEAKNVQYRYLLKTMKSYNTNNQGIYKGKIYFVSSDFDNVDKFIIKLTSELKDMKVANSQNGIKTDYVIYADAMTNHEPIPDKVNELEKFTQSNYRNDVIVTNEFRLRYELNYVKQFIFEIKAIQRFFQDDDNIGQKDYELYSVKLGSIRGFDDHSST